MIHAQTTKYVNVTPPVSVSSGALTTASIDTKGFDYCTIVLYGGVMATGYSVFKLQESDTDGSYADVTADFDGTSATFGLGESNALNSDGTASADPDGTDNVFHVMEIDLKKRKRFLDVSGTAGGTCLTAVFAILSKDNNGAVDSDSLSGRGMTGCIRA
tara:strand:- start:75 stop:551 length:477 start_codon:yes stop_codon:yes gene_type:complete